MPCIGFCIESEKQNGCYGYGMVVGVSAADLCERLVDRELQLAVAAQNHTREYRTTYH